MKIAQYGTIIVVIHAIAHGLHGLADMEIPISLSLLQSLSIDTVIVLTPIIAAVLLWMPFDRIGSWLLLIDKFGCWIGIWALKTIQQPEQVL
ncbi:hypothetical protein [Nostoc sp.]|uniref:hypothetical protein n=1 Tax=Nostoc sp. TaxID=1180 RepID=UPI002FF741AA